MQLHVFSLVANKLSLTIIFLNTVRYSSYEALLHKNIFMKKIRVEHIFERNQNYSN